MFLNKNNKLILELSCNNYHMIIEYDPIFNNNYLQLQHLRVFANGNLSCIYITSKYPHLDKNSLEFTSKFKEMQTGTIAKFCQNEDYELFDNNEFLFQRLSRLFDPRLENFCELCQQFARDELFYFIVKNVTESHATLTEYEIIFEVVKLLNNKLKKN